MSPIKNFKYDSLIKDYNHHMDMGKSILLVNELKSIVIDLNTLSCNYLSFGGEKEYYFKNEIRLNILISKTRHTINNNYIKKIIEELKKIFI